MDIRANLLVDTVALMIALLALFCELSGGLRGNARRADLRRLLIANCLVLLADMLSWLCDGHAGGLARALCYATNTAYYAMQIVYCWLWAVFARNWAYGTARLTRVKRALLALPMAAEAIMLICNPFTGGVFTLDANNHYARGAHYLYNLAPFIVYSMTAALILIRASAAGTDLDRRRRGFTLLIAMALPVCGSIIEAHSYGMTFTWPLAALSLMLITQSTQQEQNALDKAAAASLKAELVENQMSIMLSQIQPHFLYNSLTVIAELCQTDPATARQATLQFSAFLRGNMSSLTYNRPIAFERELEHTRNYIALESLRFPDRLRTVYRVATTRFQLPTLTLQPIVENAVRYGVTKRPEGGTVVIATRETPTAFIVTVSDDGVGFDPTAIASDGHAHVGLSNVRERLKRMVDGTLDIASTPGAGTTVTIAIPKVMG